MTTEINIADIDFSKYTITQVLDPVFEQLLEQYRERIAQIDLQYDLTPGEPNALRDSIVREMTRLASATPAVSYLLTPKE